MKKMYKAMALVLCAALLVAGSIFGTLAYLQDKTDTVTNTFTTGKVKISLHEFKIDNATGNKTDEVIDLNAENPGLKDIKLVPGRTIQKNPVITVEKDSEECYLFVKVVDTMNGLVTIDWVKDTQGNNTEWILVPGTTDVYYYKTTVAAAVDQEVPVFPSVTCTDVEKYEGTIGTIAITAYAVQAYGFDDAEDAWSKTFGKSTNG